MLPQATGLWQLVVDDASEVKQRHLLHHQADIHIHVVVSFGDVLKAPHSIHECAHPSGVFTPLRSANRETVLGEIRLDVEWHHNVCDVSVDDSSSSLAHLL